MILDRITQIQKYDFIIPEWEEILDIWMDSKNKCVGRYDWSKGFYMIQEGYTIYEKETLFEAHQKYLDIQIILEGKECCGFAPIDNLEIVKDYVIENDIAFYSGKGEILELNKDDMYILYPTDGHMPCCHRKNQTSYRKLVIKYEINQRGEI